MSKEFWWTEPQVIRARLLFMRRGAETERFHTVPTLRNETVGHHSFGVAWFCWLLTPNNQPSRDLLLAAMAHDLPEWKTGDIPAPSKRHLKIRDQVQAMEEELMKELKLPLPVLSELERRLLAMADIMDGLMACVRERQMGNRLIHEAWLNFSRYLLEEVGLQADTIEHRVWQQIDELYNEACK